MHMLITGGAGYVGSHLAMAALAAGHQVTVVDIDPTRVASGAEMVYGDCMDSKLMHKLLPGVDVVYHFAAMVDVAFAETHPWQCTMDNVNSTACLLSMAARHNVHNVVLASSGAVYGAQPGLSDGRLVESQPVAPMSVYACTKVLAEQLLRTHAARTGCTGAVLRFANVVGRWPGATAPRAGHLLPNALAAAFNGTVLTVNGDDLPTVDGTAVRDYVHVADVVNACLTAADWASVQPWGTVTTLNIGSGEGHSVHTVAAEVERITGWPVMLKTGARRPGDPPTQVLAVDNAAAVLGWRPTKTLADAVKDEACTWS